MTSPDYQNVSPEKACEDFKARIKLYETQYEPLCLKKDNQVRFLKVVNTGKRFVVNRAEGQSAKGMKKFLARVNMFLCYSTPVRRLIKYIVKPLLNMHGIHMI